MRPLLPIRGLDSCMGCGRVGVWLRGLAVLWVLLMGKISGDGQTLRQHPDNPRYLEWRGKPVVLVGNSEHYGAVINKAFDYRRYLELVAKHRLNLVRIFSGSYVDDSVDRYIPRNTLAPSPGQLICPWKRSGVPGYNQGGNRFDLDQWDEAYFERLKDFVSEADSLGIVVELTLFASSYADNHWYASPLNQNNNIQGVGVVERVGAFSLNGDASLLSAQIAMTRKLVTELNAFHNICYEVCYAPSLTGVEPAWERRIVDVIVETERSLPIKHLIAQNLSNVSSSGSNAHPAVSILNFLYASPPAAVARNASLRKVIGDNETCCQGTADEGYRGEAWDFLMAGGGLFNHLDFSILVGQENGSYVVPEPSRGGGSPSLRSQLTVLKDFIHGFDFVRMQPDSSVVKSGLPPGASVYALVDPDQAMAIYIRNEGVILPWSARWTGCLVAPTTGTYQLQTLSNDGVRVMVDDTMVIENWTDHPETVDVGRVRLEQGKLHRLKVEYFYNAGIGVLTLGWVRPDGKRETIPSDAFRKDEVGGTGLVGEYFHGAEFNQSWARRTDSALQFLWGTKSPFVQPVRTVGSEVSVELREGMWRVQWVDPASGRTLGLQTVKGGGVRTLSTPSFETDAAIKITRISP